MIKPDFHLPTNIYIQPDIIKKAGSIISKQASRVLIITTSNDFERYERVLINLSKSIEKEGAYSIIYDEIPDKPNTEFIDSAAYFAKKTSCDLIIGFGGFEAMNTSKAIALLTNNFLFCEDLFSGNPVVEKPVTLITIPSKPIFGFEILPFFTANDIHSDTKMSYMNNNLYPHSTIIDPNISIFATEEDIANGGMSILSIAIESLISKITSEFTNTYALKSIDLIFKNLLQAYKDPSNIKSRHPIAIASVLCGVAFSLSYLSICFAISLALTSKRDIPIDQGISLLLPHIMEYNLTSSPGKYVQMAKVMDEDVRDITVIEAAIKAVEAVRRIAIEIDIPQRLSQYGLSKTEFTSIAELAASYPFIKNAPRPLNKDEIETILIAAY